MYGGRTQPTRETSETDAIPYIRWQHMIVSAVKFRPPLRFLVLVLARAMCRTASKCFATFRLCGRGLVSAESYLTAQHATCWPSTITAASETCCVMTVVGSRWLSANVLPIWFVVAEHGPSEKSETDALPKINCHTLSQQRTDLLVGPIGLQSCIVHCHWHMHVHTAMCKLPLCASRRVGCIACLYARCYTVTELRHPTIVNKSTWKRECWHNG